MKSNQSRWIVRIVVTLLMIGLGMITTVSAQQKNWKELWAKGERPKIYWIGKVLNNPWWVMNNDFAVREANALGVDLTTKYEAGLTEKTAEQLMTEYFPLHGVTNNGY